MSIGCWPDAVQTETGRHAPWPLPWSPSPKRSNTDIKIVFWFSLTNIHVFGREKQCQSSYACCKGNVRNNIVKIYVAASRLLFCTIPPWNYIHKCTMFYYVFWGLFTTCLTIVTSVFDEFYHCWRYVIFCVDDCYHLFLTCVPLVWRCVQSSLTIVTTCFDDCLPFFDDVYNCVW
jgi:hypothetical protein